MNDISISFPPWAIAWFLLGEATPFLTLVLICLAAAFFFIRRSAFTALVLWLKWAVAIVVALWLGGISFWAAGLVDRIETDIYQARHHYQLDKAGVLAGIEIPAGSWVWVDEDGKPYEIEAADGATVAIDGGLWRGEIRLIPSYNRKTSDRGLIKSATLAADATIQGIPCRAGTLVEFSEYGGDLQHCTLSQRTEANAEIDDEQGGGKSTRNIACATDQEIWFRTLERRLLERCVLADTAMIGTVACAGDKEIVLSGDGLDMCTLASTQRVGPFDLSAGTLVGFTQGRLDRLETPPTSAPLAISGFDLPPGTVVHLCDKLSEVAWLLVPEDSYVVLGGVKLTGRVNFDCGKFEYGSLFEATVLGSRLLPRGATISYEDVLGPARR
jgi:hypothetical protein